MRVVVCKDEDAVALLASLRVKELELAARFAQQDERQRYASEETVRAYHYVLVGWLQAHGFKVTP